MYIYMYIYIYMYNYVYMIIYDQSNKQSSTGNISLRGSHD